MRFLFIFLSIVCASLINAMEAEIEMLDLDVISYDALMEKDTNTLNLLNKALYEKGIVGIRGVPGYKEKTLNFIKRAKEFSSLPEEIKENYTPNHALGETFLGYERGKEKFKRPDGTWVIDDLKNSYYANVPDDIGNKWPAEIDLKTPFQELGQLMADVGRTVMKSIELIGPKTGIDIEGVPRVGRMLYYAKTQDTSYDNPFWCGSHFDHGLFTALIPAFYFENGKTISEPMEAGLFVKAAGEKNFKKVAADDLEIMMFQVGEFAQLVTNDAIRATEHRVAKAPGCVERYTMALFFDPPKDTIIHSFSELTNDARYGGSAGDPCSYDHWHQESFKRYIVL